MTADVGTTQQGELLVAAADHHGVVVYSVSLGLDTSSRAFLERIPDYLRGQLQFPCRALVVLEPRWQRILLEPNWPQILLEPNWPREFFPMSC